MATIEQTSKFKITTIIGLVLLIVFILGLFLFVLPEREQFEANQLTATQKQTELNNLKSQLVELQQTEDAFVGGEVTQRDVLNLIPESLGQDMLIDAIANIADDNAVNLNSLTFGTGPSQDVDVNVVTITLNVAGVRTKLIDFIEALEESSRKFKINTISVQVLENRVENMSINMEAYFL